MRDAVDQLFSSRHYGYCPGGTSILVETLLDADTSDDLSEAETAVERLAASGDEHRRFVLRHHGAAAEDAVGQGARRRCRLPRLSERYRAMATSLGFEGHMEWAEAMPITPVRPSAARIPENPVLRWSFGSVTVGRDLLPQPVINRGADGERKSATLTRRHGLKNRSLKRRPSHGRRPHASIPPRSSARPSGIRP